MNRKRSQELAYRLAVLSSGEMSLEECRTRYPEDAEELAGLQRTARRVSSAYGTRARPEFVAYLRARLFDVAAQGRQPGWRQRLALALRSRPGAAGGVAAGVAASAAALAALAFGYMGDRGATGPAAVALPAEDGATVAAVPLQSGPLGKIELIDGALREFRRSLEEGTPIDGALFAYLAQNTAGLVYDLQTSEDVSQLEVQLALLSIREEQLVLKQIEDLVPLESRTTYRATILLLAWAQSEASQVFSDLLTAT